jgi:HlyD family secretion protein
VTRPRPAVVVLLLALAACDGAAEERWLQGYVEGEYLRLGAPEAGWVESVAVRRGDGVAAGGSRRSRRRA